MTESPASTLLIWYRICWYSYIVLLVSFVIGCFVLEKPAYQSEVYAPVRTAGEYAFYLSQILYPAQLLLLLRYLRLNWKTLKPEMVIYVFLNGPLLLLEMCIGTLCLMYRNFEMHL